MNDTRKQFQLLFGDKDPEHFIEVRFINPKDRDLRPRQHFFTDVEDAITTALAPPAGYDSYVGQAVRDTDSGTRRDVPEVRTIWQDLDTYKADGRSQEDVIASLKALPLPPTLIVSSGGGLHCLWKLDAPISGDEAQAIMRAMAKVLRGDAATSDPARVLRVVGTSNNKLDEPRIVRIVNLAPLNVYDPARLAAQYATARLEIDPDAESTMGYRTERFLVEGWIDEDAEYERGFIIGRIANLRGIGWEEEQIVSHVWAALTLHMAVSCDRCRSDDPWRERDVEHMVHSLFATEQRPLEREVPFEFKPAEVAKAITGRLVPLTDTDLANRRVGLDYVVDELLLEEEVVLLTGGFGVGKTWYALDLALAVADDKREAWLGRTVKRHGKVVYVDEENSQDTLLARLVQLGYRPGLLGHELFMYSFAGVRLDDAGWQRELHQLAQNLSPTLFVFDTFIRFFTSIDENDNSAISVAYQDGILPLSRQYGSSVLILDHPKKGSPEVSRGASDKVNAVDRAVAVVGNPGDAVSTFKHVKPPRRGPSPPAFQVRRTEEVAGVRLRASNEKRPAPTAAELKGEESWAKENSTAF